MVPTLIREVPHIAAFSTSATFALRAQRLSRLDPYDVHQAPLLLRRELSGGRFRSSI
jgi:hypothetical protein